MKKHNVRYFTCRLASALLAAYTTSVCAGELNFSGFISVGGGLVDDAKSVGYGDYNEEDLTLNKNLLGIQATGKVSDKLTATAQLISRSNRSYQTKAEWAYLTYQISDDSRIRVGRMRTPFYLYSDYLDVGYAYAWITPPREVYTIPTNNVDGIDFYTTTSLGKFDTSFETYFGSFTDLINVNGYEIDGTTRNQFGLVGTLGHDWWTLRAAYHQAKVTMDTSKIMISPTMSIDDFANTLRAFGFNESADNVLINKDKTSFTEIGLTIDKGRFVGAVEHTELRINNSVISTEIREFAMGGVRFNNWLVHLTYAQSKDKELHPEQSIPAGVALPEVGSTDVLIGTIQAIAKSESTLRKVITVGTRWDFTAGSALKFELSSIKDTDAVSLIKRDQKVFSVALQSVF